MKLTIVLSLMLIAGSSFGQTLGQSEIKRIYCEMENRTTFSINLKESTLPIVDLTLLREPGDSQDLRSVFLNSISIKETLVGDANVAVGVSRDPYGGWYIKNIINEILVSYSGQDAEQRDVDFDLDYRMRAFVDDKGVISAFDGYEATCPYPSQDSLCKATADSSTEFQIAKYGSQLKFWYNPSTGNGAISVLSLDGQTKYKSKVRICEFN